MKSLNIILATSLLSLCTISAHADTTACINNTIDEFVNVQLHADITVTREMDPQGFADMVRIVKSERSIDESNPQWDADEDFWLQYDNNRVLITSIHGNVAKGHGVMTDTNISKHTKQCFNISSQAFNLPFKYQEGSFTSTIHVNSTGQFFDSGNLDNETLLVHGTPFWWLDHSIPRYRVDRHSLSGRQ